MADGEARRRGARTVPAATAAAFAVGLVTTGAIVGTPYLVFGYHNPTLHLVLDSVDACIAFLLGYLLAGRFLRSRRLPDLLLALALVLLGVAGLGSALAVGHLAATPPGTVEVWLPLSLRSAGAVLVAVAALVGPVPAPPRAGRRTATAAVGLVTLTVSAFLLLRDRLPVALDQTEPASASRVLITGHPLLVTAQALAAACFLVASVLFTRRALRDDDELLCWLGPACALAGFARVNYVLFPSLYSDFLYTGDLLRTASYLLLLVGAAREIGRYWAAQTRAAVLEDRRRLARELHDGLVQELGHLRSQAHDLPPGHPLREPLIDSCDRALDEARSAVDALGSTPEERLGPVVQRAARQVAERYGGRITVALDEDVEADPEQRHALARITREAVSNALRHGGARSIAVLLARDPDGRRLVVSDDGRGFDVASATGPGYGLVSMRDRARALPGSCEVVSVPGTGTRVEVRW